MSEAINMAVEKAEKTKRIKFTFYQRCFSVFSKYNGLDMH